MNKESTRRQTGRGIPRGNPTESTEELLEITEQISTASATNGTRCGGVTQVTSALVTMRATDHRARGVSDNSEGSKVLQHGTAEEEHIHGATGAH